MDVLVIGAGIVGSATATVLRDGGHQVFGFDPDPAASERFPGPIFGRAACQRHWPLVIIAVPTPSSSGRMDAGPLLSALDLVKDLPVAVGSETVVAIRSTLVPGTMDSLVRIALSGRDIQHCYWPCFARERSAVEDERAPRHTIIGADVAATDAVARIAAAIAHIPGPISVVAPVEAELIKHGANLFNSLKISYFNAIADWASEYGGEGQPVASLIASVAEAAWNPAYGTRVGPAFGGACLTKDLDALAGELASSGGSHLALLEAVREVNTDPRRAATTPPLGQP